MRVVILAVFGTMAFLMGQGAEDWHQAMLLGLLPVSAGLASFYLISD